MPDLVKKEIISFGHEFRVIGTLISTQRHAKFHLLMSIAVIALSLSLGVTMTEACFIILSAGMVWTAEALNTAREFLTDLVSPQQNPLAGKAKDVAAAAVLFASFAAFLTGTIIFFPKILIFFKI